MKTTRVCAACGTTIEHRGPLATTCSTACYQWVRNHPGEPRPSRTCIGCGAGISHLPPNATSCNRRCLWWAARNPGVLKPVGRVCEACGVGIDARGATARTCSVACHKWMHRHPGVRRTASPTCRTCLEPIVGRRGDAVFCSATCRDKDPEKAERFRDKAKRRRARIKSNAEPDSVRALDVLERDNWTCQLCLEPIDATIQWPDPLSRSIDHVLALVNGGAHALDNLQAAHLGCNSRKGAQLL